MNPIEISCIVLACTFGGGLCGILLHAALPEHHMSAETKSVIGMTTGLIGTMTALVLGLLIASARESFDVQNREIINMSANLVFLDRVLAHYGPDAGPVRGLLYTYGTRALDRIWPNHTRGGPQADTAPAGGEVIYDRIQALSPKTDSQRSMQSQALAIAIDAGKTNWLRFEQGSSSVSTAFLVVLVSWLTLLFISFGLFAPRNLTVIATLLVCSVSVSSAILLILELYRPFQGLIQISDAPLRAALIHLGQ